MLDVRDLQAQNLRGLAPSVLAELAQQMLAQLQEHSRRIEEQGQHIERQARDIKFKDAKIEKITFELARLKRWKFDAKTESMTAAQRLLFADMMAEDEASLRAKLAEKGMVAFSVQYRLTTQPGVTVVDPPPPSRRKYRRREQSSAAATSTNDSHRAA